MVLKYQSLFYFILSNSLLIISHKYSSSSTIPKLYDLSLLLLCFPFVLSQTYSSSLAFNFYVILPSFPILISLIPHASVLFFSCSSYSFNDNLLFLQANTLFSIMIIFQDLTLIIICTFYFILENFYIFFFQLFPLCFLFLLCYSAVGLHQLIYLLVLAFNFARY